VRTGQVEAGYSASAWIVGDALQSPVLSPALQDVIAAVLLSAPKFNPADPTTDAGSFNPDYSGTPRRPPF
jgi:hypothetical protein